MHSTQRCTVDSVAARTLNQKESPVELCLPGGMIDLKKTTFEATSDRAARVANTEFHPADQYTVKLEGTAPVGYRSLFIAGASGPVFIKNVDEIITAAKARVMDGVTHGADLYKLSFRVYGKNGILMGPKPNGPLPSEFGTVGEVLADTQEIAHSV